MGKPEAGQGPGDRGPGAPFPSLPPQHTQSLTSDLVQHHVQAAAKGGIETHGHRDRHVAEGLGQAATVDIIFCLDIWGPRLGKGGETESVRLAKHHPPPICPPESPPSAPPFLGIPLPNSLR